MSSGTPVVLLHGLGRSSASLARLARRLAAHGHPTLALDYPSRQLDVHSCARRLTPEIAAFEGRTGPGLAIVGHSMGGLVARVLAAAPELGVETIVMLAPPNGGSEVADRVHRSRLARLVLGPALGDLRTDRAGLLPMPLCRIGVIAGTRAYLPITSRRVTGRHDGLVSLERTRLEAADWIAVAAGHTFLMNHPDAIEATLAFLAHGRFPDHLRSPLP